MKDFATFLLVFMLTACNGQLPVPAPTPPAGSYDCVTDQVVQATGTIVEVEDPIEGQWIVVLKKEDKDRTKTRKERRKSRQDRVEQVAGRHKIKGVVPHGRGFKCHGKRPAIEKLLQDPDVLFVQQDGKKSISQGGGAAQSWGQDRMDQRNLPLDGRYDVLEDGLGWHAYVIDTGIDLNHLQFDGRLGEGFSAFGGSPQDGHGHGTHVAGTIGGWDWGLAPGVMLHPVKVLDSRGSGTDSGVIAGIDWVTEHHLSHGGQSVSNMSLGGSVSPALDAALCDSIEAGVIHVVAAGNENQDACSTSPARVAQALTVGASDIKDKRASFSNWGICVDVFGPGVAVESARLGGGSTVYSGTSMASPHAAAAVVLKGSTLSVLSNATSEVVEDPKGSPNLLLYVGN